MKLATVVFRIHLRKHSVGKCYSVPSTVVSWRRLGRASSGRLPFPKSERVSAFTGSHVRFRLPDTFFGPCALRLRELRQEGRQCTEPICKQWRGIWFRSKASAELRFLWFVATKAFLLFYGENRVLIMTLTLSCYQSNHDHPSMHPMEPQTSKPNARRT